MENENNYEKDISNAIISGNLTLVRNLIECGKYNVNTVFKNGDSLLLVAVKNNKTDISEMLIEMGADVRAKTKHCEHSLSFFAAKNGNPELLKKLIDAGSPENDVTSLGITPLMEACRIGECTECVKILLKAGASVNWSDMFGLTPLMRAVRAGRKDMVHLLLDAGADLYAKEYTSYNYNVFDMAKNNPEILALLKDAEKQREALKVQKKSVAEKDAQIAALKKANSGKGGVVSSNGRDTVNWVEIVAEKDAKIAALKKQMRLFLDSNLVLKNGKTK